MAWRRFCIGVAVMAALVLLSPWQPHGADVSEWMRAILLVTAGLGAGFALKE